MALVSKGTCYKPTYLSSGLGTHMVEGKNPGHGGCPGVWLIYLPSDTPLEKLIFPLQGVSVADSFLG